MLVPLEDRWEVLEEMERRGRAEGRVIGATDHVSLLLLDGLEVVRIGAAPAADPAAVRRFDRNRKGRKTSNDTWQNPHDPDAKIGRTKRGSTRMVYKPEHVVDLETGAIVDADIRPGNEHDTADLTEKVLEVEARVNEVMEDDKNTERVELVAGRHPAPAGQTQGVNESGSTPNLASCRPPSYIVLHEDRSRDDPPGPAA